MKTDTRFYLSRIHIQLKAVSLLSESLHKALQAGKWCVMAAIDMRLTYWYVEYFKMVENVVIAVDELNMYITKDIL